jgi:hypothetical protein
MVKVKGEADTIQLYGSKRFQTKKTVSPPKQEKKFSDEWWKGVAEYNKQRKDFWK